MQSQAYSNAVMPLAASGHGQGNNEAATLDSQAHQQQQQQQQHQQAMMAQAAASATAFPQPQSMAGHGSSMTGAAPTGERLVGTGFQTSGSGGASHMQSNSVSSIDSNASMQHETQAAAPLAMPSNPSTQHAQQQQGYPFTGEQQQQQKLQPFSNGGASTQQLQQQPAQTSNPAFTFESTGVTSSGPAQTQHQLNFDSAPQQQQQQFQAPSVQPIQNSNVPQQQQQPMQQQQQLGFQHDLSTTSSSTRSSPVMSSSTLNSGTPTIGSSLSGPFGFQSRATDTHSQVSSAPATASGLSTASAAGTAFQASVSTPPSAMPSGVQPGGAEFVGQQLTMQQNMQPSNTSSASGSVVTSLQNSTADAETSSNGLTLSQMDPQFSLRQQHLQQQQTLQQGQSSAPVQSLMPQDYHSSAQGQELAVKACADLSTSYNKIADVLRQYTVIDMPTRMRMRQEFCNSVSALDRAFFLSPAGPGYIGMTQDDVQSTRKRAYTVNSADGDDSNKHRRTVSVTSDGRADFQDLPTTLNKSPHSAGSYASRPPLGQHTHSSPLLPAESHYRATSAGMDTVPGPKASDLAVSGSHLVGRPVIPTPLHQSVLASDGMLTDSIAGSGRDGIAPSQIQPQSALVNAGILSPTPVSATGVHLSLGALQTQQVGFPGHPVYSQEQQQGFFADGVDPSQMQIQPSTTPTPTQQQTYITPPMDSAPQFSSQGAGMQYADADMAGQEARQNGANMPPAPAATPTSVSLSQSGGSTRSRPSTRSGHPGSLDFTTLRANQDDASVTSPYASSHLSSMSSFPFSNSVTSQTSGSRSRATSISRNTSASRSRAQSINSMQPGLAHGPDAQELQNILGSLNALPSPINEDDDDEDQGNADGSIAPGKRDVLSGELLATYNKVFLQWLPRVCADVEATDRKGEKIHQPLMAKKMAKLDEEHAFRPFKFRIQPFTNSFQDACKDLGLSESDTAPKLIKHFLWNQPLISRFNDEGKKTKSRGNHVWSIEARYLAPGHYEFRPPPPKIVPLPATAAPNVAWSWSPKVLDSSCQGPPMSATFSCCNLPAWLEFKDGTLQGTPPPDAKSVMLDIAAEYTGHKLVQTFTVAVVAEDGVRPVANNNPAREEQLNSMQSHYTQTPVMAGKGHQGNYSGSSFSSELTHSTNSVMTPPSVTNMQPTSTLLPSPIPALGLDGHMPKVNGHTMGTKMMPNMMSMGNGMAPSPTSPAQAGPYGNQMAQPVPFYLPTHPTDVTTLASANHIKAKLVEATTIHHENMSALNPQHPPPDPAKVSVAVDAAINRQLAMSSSQPTMPTATEVFNATLEVSTRSQQMQQEQFTHAVSAVTQNIQQLPQQPQLSTQVTSQLANFSFTPSNTPGNGSPETAFIGQQ